MKLLEATKRACEEPTLLDALSWICVWESERIVEQARAKEQWDTCFRVCLQAVMDDYQQEKQGRQVVTLIKLAVGVQELYFPNVKEPITVVALLKALIDAKKDT